MKKILLSALISAVALQAGYNDEVCVEKINQYTGNSYIDCMTVDQYNNANNPAVQSMARSLFGNFGKSTKAYKPKAVDKNYNKCVVTVKAFKKSLNKLDSEMTTAIQLMNMGASGAQDDLAVYLVGYNTKALQVTDSCERYSSKKEVKPWLALAKAEGKASAKLIEGYYNNETNIFGQKL